MLDPVKIARDLAWLAHSPRLIDLGAPTPATSVLLGQAAAGAAPPSCLLGPLPRLPRLGLYVEQLWQTLLAARGDTTLLAHNLPLIDDTGTRPVTLGELDLLYQRHDSLFHLEVAAKFFLGLPEGPGHPDSMSRWIGTSGVDSLARKTARLMRHQLPIARHIDGTRLGLTADISLHQQVHVTGALLYPWQDGAPSLPAPRGAAAEHLRGHWVYPRALTAFLEAHSIEGLCRMGKPHWLAAPSLEDFRPPGDLIPALSQIAETQHHPFWCKHASGAITRLMVASPDWPSRIGLPPWPPFDPACHEQA
ncbi:DUF1853 family protein [Larsenimonas rhizosphaerae]|uniref:DUF1853 family protein n=1 Tax=Larsenimonas rhizosphaerae TaxID=2944682 RepID=UPI002033D63B|nr:DUF1853 family protein [Larsenimonas rhizosphaerae]MCM2130505.1 DUF1853 family protein [Larsenimonas rhizosphaerae]